MMNISNTFSSAAFLPSHTCGESEARGAQQAGGEGVFGLPGVARRLVTFFCFAKKKVTKDNEVAVKANMRSMLCRSQKATPIRHLFEVPCVARLVRRLRNSHYVLRQSSPTTPDQPALLGGGRGEGKAKSIQTLIRRVGKLPTNYQIAAWAPCAHPTGVQRDLIL